MRRLIFIVLASALAQADLSALRARAQDGDAQARFSLAVAYAKGEGVPKDEAAAVHWFRKAAQQGLRDAQFNPGLMYG